MKTLGLKNINMLSKEQYDGIAEPATDELYAISGSGFGFPSNRYIDLELGATGSKYTAPANGWFCIGKQAGVNNAYIDIFNTTKSFRKQENIPLSNVYGFCFIPCSKNDVIVVNYNASGELNYFRFIYAEGEE